MHPARLVSIKEVHRPTQCRTSPLQHTQQGSPRTHLAHTPEIITWSGHQCILLLPLVTNRRRTSVVSRHQQIQRSLRRHTRLSRRNTPHSRHIQTVFLPRMFRDHRDKVTLRLICHHHRIIQCQCRRYIHHRHLHILL